MQELYSISSNGPNVVPIPIPKVKQVVWLNLPGFDNIHGKPLGRKNYTTPNTSQSSSPYESEIVEKVVQKLGFVSPFEANVSIQLARDKNHHKREYATFMALGCKPLHVHLISLEPLNDCRDFEIVNRYRDVVKFNIIDEDKEIFLIAIKIFDFVKMYKKFTVSCPSPNLKELLANYFASQRRINRKKSFIPSNVRDNLLRQVQNFKLRKDEFFEIETFCKNNLSIWKCKNESQHISGPDHFLPRSIVYHPSGPQEGPNILFKTHGGALEIGIGSHNLITEGINLYKALPIAARSAKKSDISDTEIKINRILKGYGDYFVLGYPVEYKGSYRLRQGRVLNGNKSAVQKISNVNKVLFTMENLKGGDLFEIPKKNWRFNTKLIVLYEIAKCLMILHSEDIIQFDLKLENILMSSNDLPKLIDFGASKFKGDKVGVCGTPNFMAPEIANLLKMKMIEADFSADIWSFGVLILDILNVKCWFDEIGQSKGQFTKVYSVLDSLKKKIFSDLKVRFKTENIDPVIEIIDKCLLIDPKERLTIANVKSQLKVLLESKT